MKNNSKENNPWYLDTIERCKILYKEYYRSCMETCMCWGFECNKSWKYPLDNLSDSLESMNISYYPKYKVRIQADQVKSKIGLLHYYYSVVIDLPWYCTFLGKPFKSLAELLRYKINYKMIHVKDEPDHDEIEETELKDITNDHEFEEYKKKCNWNNKLTFEKREGKYYRYQSITHIGKSHYEPSKHKVLYKFFHILYKISSFLTWYKEPTREQDVIRNAMSANADRLIRMAEDECYKICEECGMPIGTDWSPICQTTGWISYICEKCAKKQEREYVKGDSIFHKGVLLKKIEKHEEKQ